MKPYLKLALIGFAAIPVLAAAQTNLYIYSQLNHYDINGVGGGGPFLGELLEGTPQVNVANVFLYCDSIPQEFYVGQTFAVVVQPLNLGGNTSLDPWVIKNANSQASLFDTTNHVDLSTEEIQSAIQGVIWDLDGQLVSGPMTSGDAGTANFANFLYGKATTIGTTNVTGFARFNAGPNYSNGQTGVLGQSQIGSPTPEPSAFLGLALPAVGLAFRRRAKKA